MLHTSCGAQCFGLHSSSWRWQSFSSWDHGLNTALVAKSSQLPKLLFPGCVGSYMTPTEGLYSNSSAKMFINDKIIPTHTKGCICQQSPQIDWTTLWRHVICVLEEEMPAGLWAWETAGSLRRAVSIFEGQLVVQRHPEIPPRSRKPRNLSSEKVKEVGKLEKRGSILRKQGSTTAIGCSNCKNRKQWSEMWEIIIIIIEWLSQLKIRN